ncbi:MAG: alpha/beta hydrolase [Alphaproteobacteria bacterium]|nr:MAG: alpha/beta hydrolase [Alphaproteobacteria bacterium]
MPLEPVEIDDRLSVHRLRTGGDRLVAVFKPVHGEISGPKTRGAFIKALTADPRNSLIVFGDPQNSWFAKAPLPDRIAGHVRAEAAAIGATEIVSFGSSMGGYGAIMLAAHMPLDGVVAFSPRYSPDDAVLPDPRRVEMRAPHAPFDVPTVEPGLAASPFTLVIHGLNEFDTPHVERFPSLPGMHHYLIRNAPHNIARRLMRKGVLEDLIAAALKRDISDVDALLETARARRREMAS